MVNKEKVVLAALKIITRLIDDQEAYCRDNIQTLIQSCITLSTYPESMVIIIIIYLYLSDSILILYGEHRYY